MSCFTCIVPVYNIEKKKIKRCMDSIDRQTFRDFEVILVDDGSDMDTNKYCDSFAKDNIRVIHKTNGGLASARNIGIEAATGDWIIHVDSDDWISENLFEEIYKRIDQGVDVIIFGYTSVDGEKKVEHRLLQKNAFDSEYSAIKNRLLGAVMRSNTYFDDLAMNTTWGKAFRKGFIEEIEKFDESLRRAQDAIYNLDVFWKANNIRYIDKSLYYYEIDTGSASRKYNPATAERMTLAAQACVNYIRHKSNELELLCYARGFARVCFSSIIESDFLNPANPKRLKEKKKAFCHLLNTEPYKDAYRLKHLNHLRIQDDIEDLLISFRFFYTLIIYKKLRHYMSKTFR